MSEVSIKAGKAPMQKRRKSHVGLIIALVLVFILVLPIVAVVIIFLLVSDKSHKDIPYKQNYETADVVNEILIDSLDNTVANKKLAFILAESHLNQVLQNVLAGNSTIKEFVPNAYVEGKDGEFTFVAEVNAKNIVHTRVILGTKLNIDDEKLVFKIESIKLGKLGATKIANWALGLANIDVNEINKAMKESGFNMKVDIVNLSITYPLEDFYNDVINIIGDGFGDNEFMTIFKEIISHKTLRSISTSGTNLFELDVNLDDLVLSGDTLGISGYTVPNGYFTSIVPGIITDLKGLLNSEIVSEENATVVANYFLGGDALLTDSEKGIINTYKENATFASKAYARYDYTASVTDSLKEKAIEQILPQNPIANTHVDVKYETSDLDKMFSTSTQLGKFTLFLRDVNKGVSDTKDYKVNYINIERMTTAFKDNSLFIILSMNLNGQPIHVALKCDKVLEEQSFGVLKLNLADLYLGNIVVSEEAKNKFVSIIQSALSSGSFNDLFTITNEGQVVLNLKDTLDENGVMESIGYKTSFAFESNTANANGKLVVNADRDSIIPPLP